MVPLILSVIIPVHNGSEDFRHCLQEIERSSRTPDELIIVDDSSSDSSPELALSFGAQLLATRDGPHGPAASRNRGAAIARGDVLVFIDSDVVVHIDTLALIEKYLLEQPDLSALFGSYDDEPPKQGFVSRYKNLQHHYIHQHSQREAATFWAGCGAVRREIFFNIGGFNERYKRPSVEDIELGLRLCKSGHRIWLCPDIQATHLKRWNLRSLLRSDIFDRAVPWSELIASTTHLPSNLNLDAKSRLSVVMVWASLTFLVLGIWINWLWVGSLCCITVLILLNLDLYRFFHRQGGLRFALCAIGLHWLYFIYSSITFGVVTMLQILRRIIGITRPAFGSK